MWNMDCDKEEELCDASKDGDLGKVNSLLDSGVSVNCNNKV